MRTFFRLALVGGLIALVSACAAPSHQITLDPRPKVSASEFGQGRGLSLQVGDKRGRAHLGRPRQEEGGSAIIFTEQNIANVVAYGVRSGLEAQGFRPLVGPVGRRNLRIDVRTLERTIEGNEFVAVAVLEATAINDSADPGRRYRSQYRARYAERRPLDSRQVSERVINTALEQAIAQLLQDQNLLEFLVR